MNEADLMNSIRIALTKYAMVFRVNVGSGKTVDGRFFSTGVPKGYSDLSGHRKSDGKAFYFEVKTEKGRIRKEQAHFLKVMKSTGAITGIVRSVEEAVKLIEGG
ncbi:MAG: VRR-NUC domain-containing protein [Firmicutes bacterium]|nr:VRR-NUC domain-containing protein [Bacillota bacterium]